MVSDLSRVTELNNHYEEDYYAWSPFYPEADTDLRFYLGNQYDNQEKQKLFEEGRSAFVFNKVKRNIDMITGYQAKNRLSSVVVPVENNDQVTADLRTKLLMHSMNYCDGYRTISKCFGGACKTGWNLASLWMDYRSDPINGDIRMSREPYSGFICDPYLTQLDFSDCSNIIRRKYLGVEQVASMLPDQKKEVYRLHEMGWERDDKFTWLPYQRQPNGEDLLAYTEMYLQRWKTVPMIVDMESGEFTEFDFGKDALNEYLRLYPQLKVVNKQKRIIELTVFVNNEVMKVEENPYGLNEYPFVPFVSIFESESDEWSLKVQSLIRCQRDPQREINRRISQMTDLLDSQVNSGWIADEDAVINPRSLFQSSQGKVIWRKSDAKPGAIEKIQPGQIPPSMFQLQELFDKNIVEIAGINDAAFGIADNANDSGVMMMLRQGAALTNLQDVFDNLRFSQKYLSKKMLKMMQTWTPEKIFRITGEQPDDNYYDPEFIKYDVEVQEGMLTDTQKQMYFRQLVDLKQLGVPVTGEMLAKAAPIQGKTEFLKEIAETEKQQAQAQQAQAKLQERILVSQEELNKSKSISDIALSKERFTRSVANMGLEDERASKAVSDRSDAALNKVKALKELEGMDHDNLLKYISIIQAFEEVNRVKEEQIKANDVTISASANESQPQPESPQMGQPINPMEN